MLGIGTTELILIIAVLGLPALAIGIAVLIFVVSKKKQHNHLKKCPFCAELIQPEARVCRFCGRDLIS